MAVCAFAFSAASGMGVHDLIYLVSTFHAFSASIDHAISTELSSNSNRARYIDLRGK